MDAFRKLTSTPTGNAILVALFAFLVYLKTLAPSVTFIDSGELAAVACTLGIAHPTGYPMFTLLGWFFSKLPIASEEIVRLNIMAAFFCAFGIFIFYHLVHLVLMGVVGKGSSSKSKKKEDNAVAIRVASASASLLLAFSETYWSQAVAIEVYSLHVLFLSLVTYSFFKAMYGDEWRDVDKEEQKSSSAWWYIFAFTLGLSFTNHMTTILLAPGFLYLYFATQGFDASSWKRIGRMAVPFVIGFSVYLYLPFRASQSPLMNWGNPATPEKFLWHWTGKQYRVWIFSSTAAAERQFEYFVSSLLNEFAYVGLAFALAGIFFFAIRSKGARNILMQVTRVLAQLYLSFLMILILFFDIERRLLMVSILPLVCFLLLLLLSSRKQVIMMFFLFAAILVLSLALPMSWLAGCALLILFLLLSSLLLGQTKILLVVLLLFELCVCYSINYDIHDIDSYFLLAYLCVGILSASGLLWLFRWLSEKISVAVLNSLLITLSLAPLIVHYEKTDETNNHLVQDYTMNMFASLQPKALVLSYQWDYWVSASFYYQLVKGYRADVTVVDKELLRRSWYFKQLEKSHPWLIDNSRAEVDAFMKELYKFEHELPYQSDVIQARYVEMVRSFITKNISSRPIYVTTEIEPEFTTGMQRVPEGLALRVYADTLKHEMRNVEFNFRNFERSGRLEEALKNLYANACVVKGMYALQGGNIEFGKKAMQQALTFNPNSREAQGVLMQLR